MPQLFNYTNVASYSNEEYTPSDIWEPIGPFDVDPCAGPGTCIGRINYTKADNGLFLPIPKRLTCFRNPPFGPDPDCPRYGRYNSRQWKELMIDLAWLHGNSILLLPIGGAAKWHVQAYRKADAWMVMHKRIQFGGNEAPAKFNTYLFAFGQNMVDRLRNSGLDGTLMGRV